MSESDSTDPTAPEEEFQEEASSVLDLSGSRGPSSPPDASSSDTFATAVGVSTFLSGNMLINLQREMYL